MLTVETRHAIDPASAKGLDTAGLRSHFHAGGIFADGEIRLVYTHYDRLILGGAVPGAGKLTLDHVKECGTASILDRREMGILNIGGSGTVSAGGTDYAVNKGDVLYLGMGSGPVTFSGDGRFYILSAPAHRTCPSKLIRIEDARRVGNGFGGNLQRARHPAVPASGGGRQLPAADGLHPVCAGARSGTPCRPMCMTGAWKPISISTWGRSSACSISWASPIETRHIVMANEDAVISPPWSIHCGAGTGAYTFCWAMAGDNVDFTDMDMVAMGDLR